MIFYVAIIYYVIYSKNVLHIHMFLKIVNNLFVYKSLQDDEGGSNIDTSNATMNIVDSTTNIVSAGTDKKRLREIEDVSTDESMDDQDAQRNKKATTKNITKDV